MTALGPWCDAKAAAPRIPRQKGSHVPTLVKASEDDPQVGSVCLVASPVSNASFILFSSCWQVDEARKRKNEGFEGYMRRFF